MCITNQNPIWNETLVFNIENGNDLIDRNVEISLWDLIPQNESLFLGSCVVVLKVKNVIHKF